ncbi:TetR/AcrR family transcriptional regulator [Flavobacterium johnsoniae]|uniref:Transcriptional regulator, TetR family n=1 Tax=Flavobacterium johnsoniae (strain ATCC 17061 / DSM 2064 / JCM 8514 / BCRC 14874 / CCUG 350202 / NBRC 14942 / NCIMB 11054 / UW101) TaxID=376686 RepID=A5FA47_FLAJ1|nr:TetR/AcrR family transcriptional regulator [Flavobacterium johnsoniae]ABQ07924.1 transcriptional regulator, TetR family [Flavobacterium johnsoniae UW101]OXG02003.1 TetR family transcriptional regulator [Flavobacterium johnsoniae UW101]WQG80231.1 TetR/AcrR family transcriptional regulator [Flavobacterium johnsoniae UW101]SHK97554.1 transcriptional regulator, TetR family [Flavobacterium johnsoniae]
MARTKEFNEDQVLDKAIEIFWHKGYNGTSAQDLVNHLGLSRSSLYDTFGDKQKLFARALKKYHDENYIKIKEILETATNIKETLSVIFKLAVVESLEDRITKGCFMVNSAVELAMHDADIAKIVNDNRKIMEEVFYMAVKKGQELGQISSKQEARSLARFIFNNYSGIRVLARAGERDKQVYDDILKSIFALF